MKNRIKRKKKENGITLIALVITIIVLLILAGIAIATLTGENGILNKTNSAKEKTQKETAKEKVQLAVMGSYGSDGNLDYDELKDNLKKVEGISYVPTKITKESFPLDVYVDNYKVTIEVNGNVTVEDQKTDNIPEPPKATTLDEARELGTTLDEKNPVTIKDKYGNKIVVPEGFKIADDSAEDVTRGVVIEDASNLETKGSQFVWIPVGEIKGANGVTKTINLNRYTFAGDGTPTPQGENVIDSYFQELATSDRGNTTAKDIEEFKTSVTKNGGYYIGRYEAGDSSATANRTDSATKTNIPVCKQGQYVYNYVTQPEAATLSKDMYQNKTFTSDLINTYAWDTAIIFIQEFSGDNDYSKQYRLQGTLAKTGEATDGTNKDVRCNIYDMAGNTYEWTTETSSHSSTPCAGEGGSYLYTSDVTSLRYRSAVSYSQESHSFRIALYL
ncbi:MAG: type II secretion system protein [Clostridia bacterium]|nr:type II secretion system protein [Clostridia bacterium]